MKIIAKTLYGLEELLKSELEEIGAVDCIILNRAVEFEGDLELLYKVNYLSRLSIKVLVELVSFNARNEDDLYKECFNYEWESLFDVTNTFAIFSTVNSRNFNHTKYVSLKMKDAIADRFREKYGKRPSVSIENPDYQFNLHISNSDVSVLLDASGESLHKRGYRSKVLEANLSEVLASGMLKLADYKGDTPLYDPMTGSGTIVCEAALIQKNIPAGYFRKQFGFMGWKDYDSKLFSSIKKEANSKITQNNTPIYATDLSKKSIDILREIIAGNDFFSNIVVKVTDISQLLPKHETGIMIINPPYDTRLELDNINDLYSKIGKALKFNFPNHTGWIISANFEALKFIGLKPARKIKLFNGNLEARFNKYELFKGKRKDNLTE